MRTVFYTIISNSHYHGCRTDEFIASFKHFHPDIELVVFGQKEIDEEFLKNPKLNFYNCKAHFAKLLYNNYHLVVNIDADHLILGRLDSILAGDYDVACPANYNIMANASIAASEGVLVTEQEFFQGGLIASTSKQFWDEYDYASIKHSAKFHYSENDILNVILTMRDYKVKYLDGSGDFRTKEFHSYYGCASLGQEKKFKVRGNQIIIGDKPVKAYHFSWGGKNKRHPKDLFSPEVVDFIYSNIITSKMIALKQVNGNIIDLSVSEKFKAHYLKGNTYAKFIIDNEINTGSWYDSLFDQLPEEAVIVDAGANVGLFAAYMATGKRKFYCIEPTLSHVEILVDVTDKLEIPVEIFNGVIFNKDGYVNLFEESSNSTMNRVSTDGTLVKSFTLKTLLQNWKLESVDLLKLDVESAEQQIILEDHTIGEALSKCKMVLIEVHPQDGFGNAVDVKGIIAKMKSLGFVHKEGAKSLAHYFYMPQQL